MDGLGGIRDQRSGGGSRHAARPSPTFDVPQARPGPDFPNGAPPARDPSPFELANDGSPNAWTPDAPPAGSGYHFTLRAEYLTWLSVPNVNVPIPLVTSSKA